MKRLLPGLALLFVARFALAAHALALGYAPKYPAGFSHFDYVNPQAPKGGDVVLPNPDRRTSFDSFNPFVIKGTPAPSLSPLMFEPFGRQSRRACQRLWPACAGHADRRRRAFCYVQT